MKRKQAFRAQPPLEPVLLSPASPTSPTSPVSPADPVLLSAPPRKKRPVKTKTSLPTPSPDPVHTTLPTPSPVPAPEHTTLPTPSPLEEDAVSVTSCGIEESLCGTNIEFKARTNQGKQLHTLFEALKQIIADIGLLFRREGLYIQYKDHVNDQFYIAMFLNHSKFEEYQFVRPVNAMLNTESILSVFKTIQKEDDVTFVKYADEFSIRVTMMHYVNQRSAEHALQLLNQEADDLDMSLHNHSVRRHVKIRSTEWGRLVKSIEGIRVNDYLDLIFTDHVFTVQCSSTHTLDSGYTFGKSKVAQFHYSEGVDPTERIVARIPARLPKQFNKAIHLSEQVQIYVEHNEPVVFEFCVGSLGRLKIILDNMNAVVDDDDKVDGYETETFDS